MTNKLKSAIKDSFRQTRAIINLKNQVKDDKISKKPNKDDV